MDLTPLIPAGRQVIARDLQQEVQKARTEALEKYRKAEKEEEKQEHLQQYFGVGRQFAGFTVVLAVEIETPINLSLHTAVIDLLHSRHHGAPFPDEAYRGLFASFL